MKKTILSTIFLFAALILAGCAPAANNTAGGNGNKPANAAVSNTAAAPAADAAAVETEIKKLIPEVYSALAKSDTATLEKLYDEKYVVVDIDGSVKTKAERLAEIKSGDVKFESISADEITVRTNPEGTGAVSVARATVKSNNRGVTLDGKVRVTTVWSKTKDGWKAVGAHATKITDAAPANSDAKPAANAPANK